MRDKVLESAKQFTEYAHRVTNAHLSILRNIDLPMIPKAVTVRVSYDDKKPEITLSCNGDDYMATLITITEWLGASPVQLTSSAKAAVRVNSDDFTFFIYKWND